MKWIDYREKLGIGFEDEEKFGMLKNKVLNYIEILTSYDDYSDSEYFSIIYPFHFLIPPVNSLYIFISSATHSLSH